MSKKTITKEVQAVICEFCNKEIDTKSGDYCYHHMRSTDGKITKAYKYHPTHFLFSWFRKKPIDEYMQYDFHAECFDKLMQKFLQSDYGVVES
jgi:hypothetical protein